jgi:colanic acid/amylovoran biosynthesis glycosyltransferase
MTSPPSIPARQIAYVAARLPSLSETFVYRELLALRSLGIDVLPVSVYSPSMASGDAELDRLASESLVAYSVPGFRAAMSELVRSPIRSLRTLFAAFGDAVTTRDGSIRSRLRIPVQALASLGVAARLRSQAVGHVHAHMANTPASIAMYAARHLGVPFSFTGHANDLFVHRVLLPEKLERCSFVACISHWHREFYRRWSSVEDRRSPTIRCGVDTNSVAPRPTLDAPSGPLRILSVGRLVPKKGMDTLIRAVAELDGSASVQCAIVGDGPEKERLGNLAASLETNSRITFLGPRPHEDVLKLVHECDVFVLACRRDAVSGDQDGIPVSLMEAMAAQRCVVTTSLTPVDELVIADRTGICVPPDDHAALAAALRRLAQDAGLRDSLGLAGRLHVQHEFDRLVNAARLAEHFALQHRRAPR